tara:strand:+ start:1014 stop:1940 length:927 start_codon:yes stop_codon:yes gene_type:complete
MPKMHGKTIFTGARCVIMFTLFCVSVVGCVDHETRDVTVRKLLIDLSPGFEKGFPKAPKNDLREMANQYVHGKKAWQVLPNAQEGFILRLSLDGILREPKQKGGKHLWVLTARLQNPKDPSMGDFYGYAAVPYEDGDDTKDTFESALAQCLNQVETAANTVHESTETLLTWLKPIDEGETFKGDKKRMAIRVLGARKTKAATGALGEILLGKDPALAQEALTALTLIGDPEGLNPVFDYAERKPSPVRKKAIMAAKAMGGRLAAAWLFTMSTGHEDASVRHAAGSALFSVEQAMAKTTERKSIDGKKK